MAEKEGFNQPKKSRSYRNLIIVILSAAVLIPLTVYAVRYAIELRTKAVPTEQPKQVEVTNITDTSASVSWTTAGTETIGYIKYGPTQEVSQTIFDKRDIGGDSGEFYLHYVDITSLTPDTEYHYVIVVGGEEYKNGDVPYTFKTGPSLEVVRTPQPVIGEVEDPFGGEEEVIIFLYVQNGGVVSNKISVLTTDKRYNLDLSNLRTADLLNHFSEFEGSTVTITAEGGDRGAGTIVTEIIQL